VLAAMRAVLFALLLFLWGASSASAQQFDIVKFASATHGTEIRGHLFRPKGDGPFPAIVALHGCGGIFDSKGKMSSRHLDWALRFRDVGYAVLFPDSFGSRGHGSLCKVKPRPVKHAQRVGDARAAADWLAAQPFADPHRIALLGWSNGGTTLLRALAPDAAPAKTDFIAAIAFYPGCKYTLEKTDWKPRLKPLILIGAADDWTAPEPCRKLAERWGSPLVLYEGAYHGFDAPDTPVRVLTSRAYTTSGSGTVHAGTNPAARAAAITEVMRLLKEAFAFRN
jgi:dienelactone hydrolase